ncbi:MAG: bacillithiol biosynthesis cysteine-adding enzyme BshC [Bacteroidetes bacterium]|nr:bacillithiol biosynthesis cysteine-adding enzyme BshC [Bacteroidota bacterium]
MNFQKIPYEQTNAFSSTVLDYLANKEELNPFFAYLPSAKQIPHIINDIKHSNKLDRSKLVQALKEQYNNYVPSLQVVKNIDLLKEENTFTITTAHQLNLFTGPLYYIFKILNTIRVAQNLSTKFPEFNFVPCYWMGSEDHDFEEINHTYLFSKKLEWNNFQGGSIGEYNTNGILPLIDELKAIIRQGPFLDDLIAIFKRAYSHENLAKAVQILLDELFGNYGLIVVDGNCKTLKQAFQPIIEEELKNKTSFKLVQEEISLLEQAGYKSQATPREINLFYKTNHSRERIVETADGFELADSKKQFTLDEMLAQVRDFPERFSPNVILRPVHQQLILPNIAYIGGGSEVAYWMQLKTLHEHYDVHFPMLLLRTSAQIISSAQQNKLSKLGIHSKDIFKDIETLKKEYIARQSHLDLNLESEKEALNTLFATIAQKATEVDASLENWVGAEGQKALKSIENISKRLIKSEKQKNDQSMVQIEKIIEQILPFGGLQERKENFSQFYSAYGQEWFNELLTLLDPFDHQFTIIEV